MLKPRDVLYGFFLVLGAGALGWFIADRRPARQEGSVAPARPRAAAPSESADPRLEAMAGSLEQLSVEVKRIGAELEQLKALPPASIEEPRAVGGEGLRGELHAVVQEEERLARVRTTLMYFQNANKVTEEQRDALYDLFVAATVDIEALQRSVSPVGVRPPAGTPAFDLWVEQWNQLAARYQDAMQQLLGRVVRVDSVMKGLTSTEWWP